MADRIHVAKPNPASQEPETAIVQTSTAGSQTMGPSPREIEHLSGLFAAGRYADAEVAARHAVVAWPRNDFGWKLLVMILGAERRYAEALPVLHTILELSPSDYETHQNLGNVLKALGRYADAESSYRRVLELKPDSCEAYNELGSTLRAQGRLSEAETSYRHAVQLKPDYHEAQNNRGVALGDLGRLSEAEESLRRALVLNPDYPEAHSNLGSVLRKLGRIAEAEASYHRAIELRPHDHEAYNNLGNAFAETGRVSEAEASYRRALEIKPDYHQGYSNLLFCLSHDERVGAQELFDEHCGFGRRFEAPLRTGWPRHADARDPERALRVGFVSADLRNHAMAYFAEPALAQLATRPKLSLYAYSNHGIEDEISRRMRGFFARWDRVIGLSEEALAEKIRADGIDILIDLSGHTAGNRLLTFARKPAPVQASWIGYPGTTGLSAMDYYLADRFLLPRGPIERQFTEKIVHLPTIVPYRPPGEAPEINALPALKNGYLTFGSFNRQSKFSPSLVGHWSKLLRALPDSRMLLGGMPRAGNHEALREQFVREGIAPQRLRFHPQCEMSTYLGLHEQVDLCLDTFAYTGGTTTFHALWMGVPALTIAGETAPRRQSVGILGQLGLEAFIAQDAADFVRKGLHWANHLSALASVRGGLRKRFAKSALGRPAVVAAGLEKAFRIMWQRWCQGLPPEPIDAA